MELIFGIIIFFILIKVAFTVTSFALRIIFGLLSLGIIVLLFPIFITLSIPLIIMIPIVLVVGVLKLIF